MMTKKRDGKRKEAWEKEACVYGTTRCHSRTFSACTGVIVIEKWRGGCTYTEREGGGDRDTQTKQKKNRDQRQRGTEERKPTQCHSLQEGDETRKKKLAPFHPHRIPPPVVIVPLRGLKLSRLQPPALCDGVVLPPQRGQQVHSPQLPVTSTAQRSSATERGVKVVASINSLQLCSKYQRDCPNGL